MQNFWRFAIIGSAIVGLCSIEAFWKPLQAQNEDPEEFEVYLDFRHRGVINTVVITYYRDNEFFLPVSELFSLFSIDHRSEGLNIAGQFGVDQIPYLINFESNVIRFGEQRTEISSVDYIHKELDSYLRADIFAEAFDLDFTIDFNNLTLNLETFRELPAIAEAMRRQRRQLADQNQFREQRYDLRYDRERPFLDAGFIDYNLSSNVSTSQNVYNFNTNVGFQLYGGDLQGAIFGSYSDEFGNFGTNNLRWRYMYRDQSWLSKLTIGQTTTDGVTRSQYTGIRLTNEPIEPRRLFDEFEIEGNTIPDSEVELYLNNALIDFQQADEMGDYRFLTPITYGTSRLNLRIYGPTGQIIERAQRIQVPFTFQPEGVFNYTLNAGRLDNPILGSTELSYTAQGTGSYGLTDWLTAKAGVEYYEDYHEELPTFTSSLSSRILKKYILTAEVASEVYYRGIFSAIYPNSASINIDYTDFMEGSNVGFYNPSNDQKRITASVFYPVELLGIPISVRASTFSRIRESANTATVRLDANMRLGKLNLRLGYSDRYTGTIDLLNPTQTAYMEGAATYNISRNRNLPAYMRGVFLRASMRYQPNLQQVDNAEFLLSRHVFQQGRFQVAAGRNFTGGFNTIRFSMVIDFGKVRTNSTYSNIRNTGNFTQNVRGSIGYDSNYDNFIFTSRDQVGRSGTAVKLYVDNNGNNSYDSEDEEINANAVRVQRSGAQTVMKNGVLYLTQMQPYYYYNLEMNKGALANPMLVPEFEQFGLITDPNRFKKVEIPFYMSGVMEGVVERRYADGSTRGVAGLRLLLREEEGDYEEEIRTFSDGSFYSYEIPPGRYYMVVDSGNLTKLGVKSVPDTLRFEIEAIPEGDFVEGLNFLLVPEEQNEESSSDALQGEQTGMGRGDDPVNIREGASEEYNIGTESIESGKQEYCVQVSSVETLSRASSVANQLNKEQAHVIMHEATGLYMVRTKSYQSLGEVSSVFDAVSEDQKEAALVTNCGYDSSARKINVPNSYSVQFGAFSNANRARAYLSELEKAYGVSKVFVEQDPENKLYMVRAGNFDSEEAAEDYKREQLESTDLESLFISKSEREIPTLNSSFEYRLQLGVFENKSEATSYARKIKDTFGIESKILIDEARSAFLVTKEKFSNKEEMLSIKEKMNAHQNFLDPIPHLIQQD
ncbi:SPOR domain-containing protein [Gracilimonas mengyeensis]|uniref:Sporulation related domain-containing protein n=1 Tax=Gracilimonas mengyeensis TaxID=1302730 RepID=A0A521EXS0_9BACT|nr:SPOR domain-containing protein [Gracilimonas mengyeensis]SMO88734.1 Sporulation related domain-containing protein [Gracilimonas mengyeensis]